jgi:hypothetical protein
MAAGEAAGAGKATFGPLAALRRDFPQWEIRLSDRKRFWATRIGARWRRPPANPPAWWAMTVDGDTADDLREALLVQAGAG